MAHRHVITPEQMDLMTPEERAQAVRAGTIERLEDVPDEFRQRIIERAQMLTERIRSTSE